MGLFQQTVPNSSKQFQAIMVEHAELVRAKIKLWWQSKASSGQVTGISRASELVLRLIVDLET